MVKVTLSKGSSPLTRGARTGHATSPTGSGLIPAHAGSTTSCPPPCPRSWAHPRSRGEHKGYSGNANELSGSSPLTRGAQYPRKSLGACAGLIPAHAGSTASPQGTTRPSWAHPRSRGEHYVSAARSLPTTGSSPLTRGALWERKTQQFARGLIPAHAGSTNRTSGRPHYKRAHPRSRGEHLASGRPARAMWGSSPLTRGAPRLTIPTRLTIRLIPAHAGSTRVRVTATPSRWGSSPLTRGALSALSRLLACGRLIPAHAGSTQCS